MFNHILLPLDGSPLAELALPAALELARKFESKITLLRVVSTPTTIYPINETVSINLLVTLYEQALEEANAYLSKLQEELTQQGYEVHIQVLEDGSPATAILNVVRVQAVDSIVMSTHGRGGVARWVYGSVADKVLRYAPVPVLLIRAISDQFDIEMPLIESEKDIGFHEPVY